VGTFIRNLRLHEKRQINQNEWNFDYVTDIHMFAAETGTVVLDPETQRGAFCRIDPNRLSLPPDGAGAKVDLRQILPPEELDPRRVLKDSPPTDEALGKIPIVKAYNTADYPKIILRLVKAGIDLFVPAERSCWFSKHKEDVQMAIQTHPSVVSACSTAPWQVAFAVSHRNGSAIVLREALAALGMFLRCHFGVSSPTRFLILIDSTSLLGAFAKGRSSSGRLNLFCRA